MKKQNRFKKQNGFIKENRFKKENHFIKENPFKRHPIHIENEDGFFKEQLKNCKIRRENFKVAYKKSLEKQQKFVKVQRRKYRKQISKITKEEDYLEQEELKTRIDKENKREIVAEIKNLKLGFRDAAQPGKINNVIRDISFKLYEGEILSIIGESGSGKTVVASTLFGMVGTNAVIQSGKVFLMNQEVQNFSERVWNKSKYRGSVVSCVFQNPMTTLNPTMKIKHQVMEGLLLNKIAENKKEAYQIALEFLAKTRIDNPERVMEMYPHELSGGMKQRVVISAIVACQPKIIVMDEPTTALDPSVQADILDIIKSLAREFNISIIFITHDLGVVASIADRIAIMYAGQLLEIGKNVEVLYNTQHPYAWGLLMSMPDVNKSEKLITIKGSVPGNLNDIEGEAFAPRNDYAMGIDFLKEAPTFQVSKTHFVKSWLLDKRAPKVEPPELIRQRWEKFNKMKQVNNG